MDSATQARKSNFGFLAGQWPDVFQELRTAEAYARRDPRSALLYSRRGLEHLVDWLYTAEASLTVPLADDLYNRLSAPRFVALVPALVRDKMHAVRKITNKGVHGNEPVSTQVSLFIVAELFHVAVWLVGSYAADPGTRPTSGMSFDPDLAPVSPAAGVIQLTKAQAEKLAADLNQKDAALKKADEQASDYQAKIAELQAEIAKAKQANEKIPLEHDFSEAGTRVYIDLFLAEAGWNVDSANVREYPVSTMQTTDGTYTGTGFVDYVLWGNDGKPLAVLEAKRSSKNPHAGKQQAKLYADALARKFGQRPVIYYSNGYRHWLWEDTLYPEREVLGFHTRDELQLMVDRRTQRKSLADAVIPAGIADRHYQQEAIRSVAEAFEVEKRRRALLVMATGTGKTRTVIALTQMLSENRWTKRVLFLADRNALVKQAARAFANLIPGSTPVILGHGDPAGSRLHLSTYPTIMNIINASTEGDISGPDWRGIGYYDLIIVDEAHRSVYRKYRHIFAYFDALVVGLTATPHAEVDRNTYALFGIESTNPTSAYELDEAVSEGYLVPPRALDVPVGFMREGVRYEDLSPEEQEEWDAREWDEDGEIPEEVSAGELNQWLFNADTVDKVLQLLMEKGYKVSGGDRLAKTIIFARNQNHAEFIQARFDANYPAYAGNFARVITHSVTYSQQLIDDFSDAAKAPQIAISVDMLDTGIDVPDVANLVFFKPVRSKSKFWQMVGRGTRLRPDLFAPGEDKKDFLIFDVCGNVEFFNAGMGGPERVLTPSLASRTFATRVRLLRAATEAHYDDGYREDLISHLGQAVRRLPRNNFRVRPHNAAVEQFASDDAWRNLTDDTAGTAEGALAALADIAAEEGPEETKRFDLMLLQAQLAALTGDPRAARLGARIVEIATALREQNNIPKIARQMDTIEAVIDMADDGDAWLNVAPTWLEDVRRKLRDLVPLIERRRRNLVYADFEDTLGEVREVELVGVHSSSLDLTFYRERIAAYLKDHLDHVAIQRLRRGWALTPDDLSVLEDLLEESGAGSKEDLQRAAEGDVAGFIRSLVGLDPEAVQDAFAVFIKDTTLNTRQLNLLNMIIKQLTRGGRMDAAALYDPPYTDVAPRGPEDLFDDENVDKIISIVNRLGGPGLPGPAESLSA